MRVMVLDDQDSARADAAQLLAKSGFEVVQAATIGEALRLLRGRAVDVLIARLTLRGRFTLSVALAAEYYNPLVETILLTESCGPETAEYYELVPSLRYILGRPLTSQKILRFLRFAVNRAVRPRPQPALGQGAVTCDALKALGPAVGIASRGDPDYLNAALFGDDLRAHDRIGQDG